MTIRRRKDNDPARRPTTDWLAGAMIGLTISTLATSAIMLGTSLAIGQAIGGGK